MAIVQNPQDLTKFIDLSDMVVDVPVRFTMTEDLGLFSPKFLSTSTAAITRTSVEDQVVTDKTWGSRAQNLLADTKAYLTVKVPNFGLEDAIHPEDLDGNWNWDMILQGEQPESLVAERERKLSKMRQTMMNAWETARIQLLVDGTAYAPNGTLVTSYGPTINFYTEFGVTRQDFEVSLNDETVDVLSEVEPMIAYTQDNLNAGVVVGQFIAVCGKTFFSKLVSHPYVKDAGKYIDFSQSEEVLLGRLTARGLPLDSRYRAFSFGGVIWVENRRADFPAAEARIFPSDLPNMFVTYFAPHKSRFSTVNGAARDMYYFEKLEDNVYGEHIDMYMESNFLNVCLYPQALNRVVIAA